MKIDIETFAMLAGRSDDLTVENIRFRMMILSDERWLKALHLNRREAGRAKVRYHAQLWGARYAKPA
jgi:hypothetical protein